MFKSFIVLVLVTLSILIYSCSDSNNQIQRSFYFWKTRLEFDSIETKLINTLKINHLYLKLFDVEWSEGYGEAIPAGNINGYFPTDSMLPKITPVVFITNQVLEQCNEKEINSLAIKIVKKANKDFNYLASGFIRSKTYKILEKFPVKENVDWKVRQAFEDSIYNIELKKWLKENNEFQIDCDWTEKTKIKYFKLLEKIKENASDKKITCTLRLWQYKYKDKAGIPPVERCMLMCYSTGNPKEYYITNSIATYDEIKQYIKNGNYPLSLDIALPIFSWGAVFRNTQFKGLIYDYRSDMLLKDTAHFKHLKDNRFIFKRDTVVGNTYLRFGDEIRTEQVSQSELESIIKLLKSEIKIDKKTKISFFSWDTLNINYYGKETINKLFTRFE